MEPTHNNGRRMPGFRSPKRNEIIKVRLGKKNKINISCVGKSENEKLEPRFWKIYLSLSLSLYIHFQLILIINQCNLLFPSRTTSRILVFVTKVYICFIYTYKNEWITNKKTRNNHNKRTYVHSHLNDVFSYMMATAAVVFTYCSHYNQSSEHFYNLGTNITLKRKTT